MTFVLTVNRMRPMIFLSNTNEKKKHVYLNKQKLVKIELH